MQSTSYESKNSEWEGINSDERLFSWGIVPFNEGMRAGNSFKYQKVDRRQNVVCESLDLGVPNLPPSRWAASRYICFLSSEREDASGSS